MRKGLLKIAIFILVITVGLLFGLANYSGWFETGQDASILLSGIGFNKTGGALLFNHPMKIATDGERLLLADTRNNRIFIWSTIPDGNVKPDIVLGQKNFNTNSPGTGMSHLNWPVGVATADDKVVVADTYNDRILIWNIFPTVNGQAADLSLESDNPNDPKEKIEWPWGVWTDGTKLLVASTRGGAVLIYNTFPTNNNQKADLYLKGKNPDDGTNRFGTPRTIGTDTETYLMIGDHNAYGHTDVAPVGSFVWKSFPTTDNKPYNFFMANPKDTNQMMWGGVKTIDGRFITVASPGIAIWNSVPTSVVAPDLFVGRPGVPSDETGYYFNDGDGSDLALTPSGKLFISLYNSNKVVAFNSVPTSSTQCPDFAIGAPDIDTNTLDTNYIITNGIPATDGASLFVSADFDKKLYVWKSVPSKSGVHPDIVYDLDFAPWDNALYGDTFVIGGRKKVQVWREGFPLHGNLPDITFDGQIGSVSFQDIQGVAVDDKYLYIADYDAGKLYVWSIFPESDSSLLFSLGISGLGRICSDGKYLAVTISGDHKIQIYNVDGLSASSSPEAEIPASGASYNLNLPNSALIAEDHLFVADTGFNRVLGWKSIEEAISGDDPDVILGQESLTGTNPSIGIDRLFFPAGLAFYRNRLWVGEFKFSGRLVGFKYKVQEPFIETKPTYGGFGNIGVGSNSKKTFMISNTGKEDLDVGQIMIGGKDKSQFTTKKDRSSGKTLTPSRKCRINVIFSPTSEGPKKATLIIPSNDPAKPSLKVPLYGIGTSGLTSNHRVNLESFI